jgi:Ca2+-binding EF-hand superfamily protein
MYITMKTCHPLALITMLTLVSTAPALAGQAQQRQRGTDTDRDGVITRAEWRGTAESFTEHDKNRDGVISGTEVNAAVQASAADDARRRERARVAAMDADRDGVITRAEWRGTADAFRLQDTNRDGVVSGTEVPASAAADPRTTAETTQRREATSARFAGMDGDNDGVITRAEWRGGNRAFEQHDKNGDRVLSGAEVRAGSPEPVLTAEETRRRDAMAARFTRADRNRDGRIARDEWMGNAEAFTRLDRNADGHVTRDEYIASSTDVPAATSGERRPTPAYQAGHAKGLLQGRDAGKADRSLSPRGSWDLEGQSELEQADSGYEERLGARADYQAGYRAGFRLGYKEGFGPR